MPNSSARPYERTVFTEVCRMTGDRSSAAAASTASMLRSLMTLKAATPYRSANARSRISFIATTGTKPPQTCSAGSAPRRRDASETRR